jgi:hypothetical protein
MLVRLAQLESTPSFSNGKLVVRDKKNYYCVDLSPTAASVP